MKIIWTFTLMMIPGVLSSISVTGYSGGGVTITCRYDRKYTANEKYFCKGRKPDIPQIEWCSNLIKTETKDEWVHSGRFSLYDDTTANIFNVIIRDLSEQDSGTYQCAADISWIGDSYTEVNLNVISEAVSHRISTSTSSSFSSAESPMITSVSPVTGSSLIIIVSVLLLLIITHHEFII
ncbi:hypothetical protein Q8A67_005283 [Cirrhinus molitorella]|uniref:Ig-like domain-containing protein n=1 Tax=Cirrhinus molitorella TaxID=172907 RepID=A0AA88Q9L5_9TELE|nr:hypothetical protein Q8A67_005283 [Cirrhinus molitorella]